MRRVKTISRVPNRFFSVQQLNQIAAEKYAEAAAAEGQEREELLKLADAYFGRANVRRWIETQINLVHSGELTYH